MAKIQITYSDGRKFVADVSDDFASNIEQMVMYSSGNIVRTLMTMPVDTVKRIRISDKVSLLLVKRQGLVKVNAVVGDNIIPLFIADKIDKDTVTEIEKIERNPIFYIFLKYVKDVMIRNGDIKITGSLKRVFKDYVIDLGYYAVPKKEYVGEEGKRLVKLNYNLLTAIFRDELSGIKGGVLGSLVRKGYLRVIRLKSTQAYLPVTPSDDTKKRKRLNKTELEVKEIIEQKHALKKEALVREFGKDVVPIGE